MTIFLSGFFTGALLAFTAVVLIGVKAEERERKAKAQHVTFCPHDRERKKLHGDCGAKVIVSVNTVELRYE